MERTPMRNDRFDLIVVGAGPGGYYGAILASIYGKRTLLIEKNSIGGTCLNRGCIPSKALLASAHAYQGAKRAPVFGVEVAGARFDIRKMQQRKESVVKTITGGVEFLLKKREIPVVRGTASLSGPTTVSVQTAEGKREFAGEAILLAPGSVPVHLPIPGLEGDCVWDSDRALSALEVPNRLAVIGGGAIGLELGQYFHMLGSQVTIIEILPQIMPPADAEAAAELARALTRSGITLMTGSRVTEVRRAEDGVIVAAQDAEGHSSEVQAEIILEAVGRKPATEGLGLEECGVELERGRIVVDRTMRTTLESVWAAGDATGKLMLAHAAFKHAEVAVANICGRHRTIDYAAIPSAVYTAPELAWVGLTEEELRAGGVEYKVGSYPFRANGRSVAEGNRTGFCKILAAKSDGRLLAAHIVGPSAADLISAPAFAIGSGATAEEFLARTTIPHPTLSEVLFEAAADCLGESVHKG
jgi:dihydrolipoamide dehydrogenase